MATQFPKPIEVPIVVHKEYTTTSVEMDSQQDILPILPTPTVPDYSAVIRPIIAVRKQASGPELADLRAISIEPTTGYIYVPEMGRSQILIFSQNGEFIKHFGRKHLLTPWGILIHQDSIYVTDLDHRAIFRFRLPDLKMVKRAGKFGSGREQFYHPSQLAISPSHDLYVTDTYNHRLHIMTTDLKFKDILKHQTMKDPCDVKFSNSEMFVLSFIDNPCMHVFTLSGEKIRSLVTRGYEKGMQVREALHFCLDGYNNFVISDSAGHTIRVFSPDGHLLRNDIIEQKKLRSTGFSYPNGITMYNNNKLICVSFRSLHIFSYPK